MTDFKIVSQTLWQSHAISLPTRSEIFNRIALIYMVSLSLSVEARTAIATDSIQRYSSFRVRKWSYQRMFRLQNSSGHVWKVISCLVLLTASQPVLGAPLLTATKPGGATALATPYQFVFQCSKRFESRTKTGNRQGVFFSDCSGLRPALLRYEDHADGAGATDAGSLVQRFAAVEPVLKSRALKGSGDSCEATYHVKEVPVGYVPDSGVLTTELHGDEISARSESSLPKPASRATGNFAMGERIAVSGSKQCTRRRPLKHHDYCRCIRVVCTPLREKCFCTFRCGFR